MDLTTLKYIAAVVIFVAAWLGYLFAVYLSKKSRILLSLSNCLSAGVFLAAGLVHLLAEASEELTDWYSSFPLAFALCGVGFTVTLFMEQVVGAYMHLRKCQVQLRDVRANQSEQSTDTCPHSSNTHEQCQSHTSQEISTYSSMNHSELKSSQDTCKHPHEAHNTMESITEYFSGAGLVSGLLAMALSFHAIVAGLALGFATQSESVQGVWIAIVAHKSLASYALVNNLLSTGAKRTVVLVIMCIFSLITPVGVFIGIAVRNNISSVWAACIQSLASGIFLYVAIVELLMHELGESHVHSHGGTHLHSHNAPHSPHSTNMTAHESNIEIQNGDTVTSTRNMEEVECAEHKLAHLAQVSVKQVIQKLTSFCIGFAIMSMLAIWT